MPDLDLPERLRAFRGGLLQYAPVPALDDICDEAARMAETPIALVSLVMEHVQWFRASRGLPADLAAARATNRCDSFCQFVVRDDRPFIVVDAPNDARVPQELVSRYGIGAYLGVPVRADGQVLGSLCVIDVVPRRFSDTCIQALVGLAARASAILEALAREEAAPMPAAGGSDAAPAVVLADVARSLVLLDEALTVAVPAAAAFRGRPRSAWTPEALVEDFPTLDVVRALVGDLRLHLARMQTSLTALRRIPAPEQERVPRGLLLELIHLERALVEGGALFHVVESWMEGAFDKHLAARAISVLHMAFAFFLDAHEAVQAAQRTLLDGVQDGGGAQ